MNPHSCVQRASPSSLHSVCSPWRATYHLLHLLYSLSDVKSCLGQVRDDLQSTRQLLGEEVKSRERLSKENKHLRAELERMREEMARSKVSNSATPTVRLGFGYVNS